MTDMLTIRVSVRTDKVGSECTDEIEIERSEWAAMTDEQRDEMCRDVVWNMAEWSYEEIDQ